MTRLTVVTGWSPQGYIDYGKRFAETFDRYWPADVDLVVYGEEPVALPRGEFRLLHEIPQATSTLRHYDNTMHRGRAVQDTWKQSAKEKGYNFRLDAWKFCRQGLIPMDAGLRLDPGELLCWLDGDVFTHHEIPPDFIPRLLPDHCDIAYLGRGDKYSEIGFQLYRMPRAMLHLIDFSNLFATGEILKFKEWHSAFAFDIARKRSGLRAHDLTPGGRGHVWKTSPLEKYMTHLKGDRKITGIDVP